MRNSFCPPNITTAQPVWSLSSTQIDALCRAIVLGPPLSGSQAPLELQQLPNPTHAPSPSRSLSVSLCVHRCNIPVAGLHPSNIDCWVGLARALLQLLQFVPEEPATTQKTIPRPSLVFLELSPTFHIPCPSLALNYGT
ncbi:hypothetical protein LIA77_00612 [Sarocladium implicatum]|nr:hypothetical protein LIA77_00612 [Sarocladium implicatum]